MGEGFFFFSFFFGGGRVGWHMVFRGGRREISYRRQSIEYYGDLE